MQAVPRLGVVAWPGPLQLTQSCSFFPGKTAMLSSKSLGEREPRRTVDTSRLSLSSLDTTSRFGSVLVTSLKTSSSKDHRALELGCPA